jgi:hypothetical protein
MGKVDTLPVPPPAPPEAPEIPHNAQVDLRGPARQGTLGHRWQIGSLNPVDMTPMELADQDETGPRPIASQSPSSSSRTAL